MAIVNFGGFETGVVGTEAGTSSGTIAIVTTPVKHGTYALQVNPATTATGTVRFRQFNTSGTGVGTNLALTDTYLGFYFRVATLPSANSEEICHVRIAAGTYKMSVRINSAGNLMAFGNGGTTQIGSTGATVLALNTWYFISLRCGTGASAAWSVAINGVTEMSGSTDDLNTTAAGAVELGKSTNRNGETVDFFYDCWIIDDATLPTDGMAVRVMTPDGDGNYVTWTRGGTDTGADWSQVSEVVPDTTSYLVSTLVANERSHVTLASSAASGISGTIHAVKPICTANRAGAANGTIAVGIRSGGTDSDNAGNAATAAAVDTYCRTTAAGLVLITDPTDAAAWTVAKLDALEVGLIEKEATDRSRWQYGAVMVLFTAANPRGNLTLLDVG